MKKFFLLFILASLSTFIGIRAQSTGSSGPVIPLQKNGSPVFGNDVVMHDLPDQNQRQVAICSAFNGWLYALYTYIEPNFGMASLTILRSTDNGSNWSVFKDIHYPLNNSEFLSADIITTGDSLSNLKLYFAVVVSNSPIHGQCIVNRYNGETGVYENTLLEEPWVYQVAISNDFMYPAANSNPYSIGLLYSKYSNQMDSIIFRASGNGGLSFNNRNIVAVSVKRFHKVALCYGRSHSKSSGRYFAAWEEKEDFTSTTGHIFTSHSDPNFNSPFTTPVKLDSIDPSALNNARNPVIACQFNTVDDDSSDLTEVVLFDKFIPSENRFNIAGYFNKRSTITNHFNNIPFNSAPGNRQEVSVNFNPFDSKFMVTYYDSTTQKLPFVVNDFNMASPDNWQVVSPAYNDATDLTTPYPRVALNIGQQQGAVTWAREGIGGNGVAMFDAPYHFYTGINPDNEQKSDWLRLLVLPNPVKSEMTVTFELADTRLLSFELVNSIGQSLKTVPGQTYSTGWHQLNLDMSTFLPGIYTLICKNKDHIKIFKIIKVQ